MGTSENRYTMKEIAQATNIQIRTLYSRRNRLGIPANKGEYTLEEVKKLIKLDRARMASQERVKELREMLNDGTL